jgi:hypothetical protein
VQIIVEISLDEDGRAVGTVRSAGHTQCWPFSGNLEFLALVENLYRVAPDTVTDEADPRDKDPT